MDDIVTHYLKVKMPWFENLLQGRSNSYVTSNEPDFHQGDMVVMEEWNPNISPVGYTGRRFSVVILAVDANNNGDCTLCVDKPFDVRCEVTKERCYQ